MNAMLKALRDERERRHRSHHPPRAPTTSSSSSSSPRRVGESLSAQRGLALSTQGSRAYRKVVVVASFPWLCHPHSVPGHMTLLYWVSGDGRGTITQRHVDAVRNIIGFWDRPFARNAKTIPDGSTFLFDSRSGEVDPEGPIGKIIGALGRIDPVHMPHTNSCGQSGLEGLHVSAGLLPEHLQRFDDNMELLARHSDTTWVRGRSGYELPLCLQMTTHLAPLEANYQLFYHLTMRRDIKTAAAVANSPTIITSGHMARTHVLGCGAGAAANIDNFFLQDRRAAAAAAAAAAKAGAANNSSSSPESSSKKKRRKTAGRPPVPGRGAGTCIMGEMSDLPYGMVAPPCVEYELVGAGAGRVVRIRYFKRSVVHSRKNQGKVDPKLEALNSESGIRRLRKLTTEPPGLRFLRWEHQQSVLRTIRRPLLNERLEVRRRNDAFFSVFDALVAAKAFTKTQALAALRHNFVRDDDEDGNVCAHLTGLANCLDSHDKSRFWPIPFNLPCYMVADAMVFGALPPCPRCGQRSLLGSPSGWISCKGWHAKEEDRPCTFQTSKAAILTLGEDDDNNATATKTESGTLPPAPVVRRNKIFPGTGREWEMPEGIKPRWLRQWRQLLLPEAERKGPKLIKDAEACSISIGSRGGGGNDKTSAAKDDDDDLRLLNELFGQVSRTTSERKVKKRKRQSKADKGKGMAVSQPQPQDIIVID